MSGGVPGNGRTTSARAMARDAAPAGMVLSTTMSPNLLTAPSPLGASSGAVGDAPPTPSAALDAVGGALPQRFRDRVRARTGASDVLVVQVGAERFAFDVRALDEAIDAPAVAPTPGTRVAGVAGVVRLGERTVPVFDAGALLGIAAGERRQLLLLRAGDARVGLLVDDVDDVAALQFSDIQPPPFDGGDDLLLGVTWDGERLTAILDARALVLACQHRLRHGDGA